MAIINFIMPIIGVIIASYVVMFLMPTFFKVAKFFAAVSILAVSLLCYMVEFQVVSFIFIMWFIFLVFPSKKVQHSN